MTRTQFYYKNHRGVTELRTIEPVSLQYVASPHLEYGYAPGWFLHGLDFTERDGVARTGEGRSFSLDHIQMEGFKYGTKGGAAAFHLMLQPGFVPVERSIPEVVLNSETGGAFANHREPGEFGEGATVRSYEDQGTAHDPHAAAHELQGRRHPVDEILKK